MRVTTKTYISEKPCKRGHYLRYINKGCVECTTLWTRERYKKDPKTDNAKSSKWYKANPEKNTLKRTQWGKTHPEKQRAFKKIYRQRHPEKHYRKKKHVLRAAPKWLSKEQWQQIENTYSRAKEWTKMLGVLYEVDHVVPLKGKDVCGLHVPWNLQILTATENNKKSNHFLD